jgi:colanic acid/amylovoran biosynthesis protein
MRRVDHAKLSHVMKILIPNATSPKNTGDQAMLTSLLTLIRRSLPAASVYIQSVDPAIQKKLLQNEHIEHSVLSWLLFEKPQFVHRVIRLIQITVALMFPKFIYNKKLKNIVRKYQSSDLIIFAGHGYLRSTKGVTQSVLLMIHLVPYLIAKVYQKHIIVAPMSFGPFAYQWQETLVARVLSRIPQLYIREEISLAAAHTHGLYHAKLSPDLALLLPKSSQKIQVTKSIGVSLRNWYTPSAQHVLETEIISSLTKFAKETGVMIRLFVNVDAPEHKDIDLQVATRVYAKLVQNGVSVEMPIILRTYTEAIHEYTSCTMLIGMRMHANIIAATQHIPFIGIAYEHKTIGIAKMIHMDRYCIWGYEVTTEKLLSIIRTVYTQHKQIKNQLSNTLEIIQKSNTIFWQHILTSSQ